MCLLLKEQSIGLARYGWSRDPGNISGIDHGKVGVVYPYALADAQSSATRNLSFLASGSLAQPSIYPFFLVIVAPVYPMALSSP